MTDIFDTETLVDRDLKSIIDTEAKAYAIYTVENRAIPNMIDGLKPVHRFVLARSLDMARGNKDKFHKLASISGGVADYGYHHGEASAEAAGAGLASTWNNNFPLFDGSGNFGSRLKQEASAGRYIFARVSKNFYDLYKDTEYAPAHEDVEHKPPAFFLPIIPFVLLNGISGIATGFATDILPHSLESVAKAVRAVVNGEEPIAPEVQYPKFKGKVINTEEGKYELHGTYKFTSRTQMTITEVPYKFDRETYIKRLDVLADKGYITYSDECDKVGFGFKVKFRKEYALPDDEEERHEKIMKDFLLIEKLTQNLTVINEKGRLVEYNNPLELIRDFVKIRQQYVQKRIDNKIIETHEAFRLALAKAQFIKNVIDGTVIIQGKTRKQLLTEVGKNETYGEFAEKLVAMNIFHMTSDEAKKLALEAKAKKDENDYWKNTTATVEYNKDLDAL